MPEMKDYDWPKTMEALQFLLEKSQEEEPSAEIFHAAIEETLAGFPEEAFE